MMVLTVLSSAVKCEWDLEDYEEALITMVIDEIYNYVRIHMYVRVALILILVSVLILAY